MTAKDTGQKVTQINLSHLLFRNNTNIPTIKLNKTETRQEILGFGGAFTEVAACIYHKLDNEKKEEIIQAYFVTNGNGYTMGRTHINSCDFSLGNYTYCNTSGDMELQDFSESEIKSFINENKDNLKDEYIDFTYIKITPNDLTGSDQFNELFFKKIEEFYIF